ncbi:MAG: hypothetical protein DSY81_03150 [Bacillota bacterium]|nr:MAG: hypothetical protein DSY92_10460 [Planctomycetota bacterium]RUA10567.1 MAG: hypothetical protein DSY81_03150 [Bacillota bacterium]
MAPASGWLRIVSGCSRLEMALVRWLFAFVVSNIDDDECVGCSSLRFWMLGTVFERRFEWMHEVRSERRTGCDV